MFDPGAGLAGEPGAVPGGLAGVLALVRALADGDGVAGLDDVARVDVIRSLEELKAAAAAAQARVAAAFVASQRSVQRAAGVPERRAGQGVPAQVGLARRESPARAGRYCQWAAVLVSELPCTFAALRAGETSEWRAMIVARETIWLTREQRATVDAELGPRLEGLGDREVEAEARKAAYRLDPHGSLARSRAAVKDRRVSLRPAPDTMARLSALLPVAQGVAAYAALVRAADTARATGDARGRGQVMADTLVERVTGQASADGVPVEVVIVMTEHTLTGTSGFNDDDTSTTAGGETVDTNDATATATAEDTSSWSSSPDDSSSAGRDEPARLQGYGPVPAGLARDLVRHAAHAFLRRLHTDPVTGRLTALDPRRRFFPQHLRDAIAFQDVICRNPWCNAPIRHTDHAVPVSEGGKTVIEDGQGLCEGCDYTKTAPGWTHTPHPDGGTRNQTTITTPTGHTYTSPPPDLPGQARRPRPAGDDLVERGRPDPARDDHSRPRRARPDRETVRAAVRAVTSGGSTVEDKLTVLALTLHRRPGTPGRCEHEQVYELAYEGAHPGRVPDGGG